MYEKLRRFLQRLMLAKGYKPCQRCGKWKKDDIYLLCQSCFDYIFDWSELE